MKPTLLPNPRIGLRLVTLAVALGFAVASLGLPATAPAAPRLPELPEDFFGVSPQTDRPQADYYTMKRGGVDSVRFQIGWNTVEKQPGVYDFGDVDRIVERTAKAGIEAFPFVAATPTFYGEKYQTLPVQTSQQRSAWVAFLRALVARYGPSGTFWGLHGPSSADPVPYRPIDIWQIWNESNFFYFADPISPPLYADLVKLSHDAIIGVDPGATIVLAGLFSHPRESLPLAMQATDFLDAFYNAPGIRAYFDGVALHPYAFDARQLQPEIESIREILVRHDDADADLYLDEFGWGSNTDTAFERGPEGQIRELEEAYTALASLQRSTHLQRTYWFAWDDLPGSCNFCESMGLVDRFGLPKPAWGHFVKYAGCFGRLTTVQGTDGNDVLLGTPGSDVIAAEDGADRIKGGGGADFICGGPGVDQLIGNGGRDRVSGQQGNDRILLGGGKDTGDGGSGKDLIDGGPDADLLQGRGGPDRLLGRIGKDRIFGEAGKDTLFGGPGDDFLRGGSGRDVLAGGPGRNNARQ